MLHFPVFQMSWLVWSSACSAQEGGSVASSIAKHFMDSTVVWEMHSFSYICFRGSVALTGATSTLGLSLSGSAHFHSPLSPRGTSCLPSLPLLLPILILVLICSPTNIPLCPQTVCSIPPCLESCRHPTPHPSLSPRQQTPSPESVLAVVIVGLRVAVPVMRTIARTCQSLHRTSISCF